LAQQLCGALGRDAVRLGKHIRFRAVTVFIRSGAGRPDHNLGRELKSKLHKQFI
jgi:hypothetical protein